MLRAIGCVVLAVILFCIEGVGQGVKKPSSVKNRIMFAENEAFSKGGIGIVNTNLYIVVKSDKNELLLSGANKWTGQAVPAQEVVIFYEDKIWSPQVLPEGFDLSKTIVISFEADKIRFFDFGEMTGGYYKRMKPDSD